MTPAYLLNAVAALALLCIALDGLNRMSKTTRWQIRIAYIVLSCGAFAVLVSPLFDAAEPSWVQICSHWGIAFLLFEDKRRCHWDCTPEKRRKTQQ